MWDVATYLVRDLRDLKAIGNLQDARFSAPYGIDEDEHTISRCGANLEFGWRSVGSVTNSVTSSLARTAQLAWRFPRHVVVRLEEIYGPINIPSFELGDDIDVPGHARTDLN